MTNISLNKNREDRVFSILLIICIWFVPVFIACFGSKLFKIPVFLLSFLVVLRLVRCHNERSSFFASALSVPSALILLSSFYIFIHGIFDIYFLEAPINIISKPFIIISCWILLVYFWSYNHKINNKTIIPYIISGHIICFLFFVLSYFYMLYLSYHPNLAPSVGKYDDGVLKDLFKGGMLYINVLVLTAALSTSSIMIFFYAPFFKKKYIMYGFLVSFSIFLFVMTFFVIGYHKHAINITHIVSETSQFGLPLALTVVLITYFIPHLMTNLFFASSLVLLIAAPWVYQYLYQLTFYFPALQSLSRVILVRLEIWDAVSRHALLSPLWGHGINNLKYHNALELSHTYLRSHHNIIHPHNMILQVWNDCGAIGVAILIPFFTYGWKFINTTPLRIRPVILGGLTFFMVFILVTYSLWIPWVITFISFSVLLIYLSGKENEI